MVQAYIYSCLLQFLLAMWSVHWFKVLGKILNLCISTYLVHLFWVKKTHLNTFNFFECIASHLLLHTSLLHSSICMVVRM